MPIDEVDFDFDNEPFECVMSFGMLVATGTGRSSSIATTRGFRYEESADDNCC